MEKEIQVPLSMVQQAVEAALSDQLAAMMAGFEATAAEVRSLRRVVEQLPADDDAIGQAAERYTRKMAVVHGGY